MDEVQKRLQDAMVWLVYKDPLLSEFAEFVKLIPDQNVPTAGVRMSHNYIMLYYNEEWIGQRSQEELRFIMKHELYHVILAHVFHRLKHPVVDNIAADMEINQSPMAEPPATLKSNKPGEPSVVVYSDFKLPQGDTREFYYQKLMEQSQCPMAAQGGCKDGKGDGQKCKGHGKGGQGDMPCPHHQFDDHGQWSESTPDVEEVWRQKVESTIESAKMRGTIAGRLAEQILAKWKKHRDLLKLLKRVVGKEISQSVQEATYWKKRNKRFPLYPGNRDMYGPRFIIAVDTSGSMSTPVLETVFSIVKWIKRQGYDGKLIQCDCEVSDVSTIGKLKADIQVRGRGGTSSKPVFDLVEKENWRPDLLIYFSDMEIDTPDKAPSYKTIWVKTGQNGITPHFGRVIDA
jgi:predicted metal-dependent peptidase